MSERPPLSDERLNTIREKWASPVRYPMTNSHARIAIQELLADHDTLRAQLVAALDRAQRAEADNANLIWFIKRLEKINFPSENWSIAYLNLMTAANDSDHPGAAYLRLAEAVRERDAALAEWEKLGNRTLREASVKEYPEWRRIINAEHAVDDALAALDGRGTGDG